MPHVIDRYIERFGPMPVTTFNMSDNVRRKLENALEVALRTDRPLSEGQWLALDAEALQTVDDGGVL